MKRSWMAWCAIFALLGVPLTAQAQEGRRPTVSNNPYGDEPARGAQATPAEEEEEPPEEADQAEAEDEAEAGGPDGETAAGAESEGAAGTAQEGERMPATGRVPVWAEGDATEDTAVEGEGPMTPTSPPESFPQDTPPVVPTTPTEPVVTDEDAGGIPLDFHLNGYYRLRYQWTGNVPLPQESGSALAAENAHFAFQRLRLEPSVTYGSDPDNPVVALYTQFDGLDNVVLGDNNRLQNTPLFALDPSNADFEGFDVPSFRLERAWLEFLIPVGQVRVGRMPSQWGLGILTTDGNGLGEWGDPEFGTTYDRVLFATRPLSIVNALTTGDARPTPLITAFAYDKLVEDPLSDDSLPVSGAPRDPATRTFPPTEFLADGADDVQEFVGALLWSDPNFHPMRESDELHVGFYYVHRWQSSTESRVNIFDLFWRLRYTPTPTAPTLYTAGEIVHIRGSSRGIALPGCPMEMETGRCNDTDADIWGAVGRVGAIDRNETWAGTLELGYSSGDGQLFASDELTARPLNPDYHVGLLMYRVALAQKTALGLGEPLRPLWSRGGVWNSSYIYPQARYEVLPGVEVHGAFLMAWADELLPTVFVNQRDIGESTGCSLFEGECLVGWEADLALRLKWGENDLMWWDTEAGIMRAGDALIDEENDLGLGDPWLWTVQSRVAMQF